jgi:hypothetical protein
MRQKRFVICDIPGCGDVADVPEDGSLPEGWTHGMLGYEIDRTDLCPAHKGLRL